MGSDVHGRIEVRNRFMAWFAGIAVSSVFLVLCGSAAAHHGASAYDTAKPATLKGTVVDFQFINPHVIISVDVTNEKGRTETWIGEANSPNVLSRHGWDRNIIKKGDQITVVGNPGKNGSRTLRLQKVILSSGEELDPNSLKD
jgi:Family of unknown function (DUF6152)